MLLTIPPVVADAQQTILTYAFADTSGAPTSAAAGGSSSEFVHDSSADTSYDNTVGNPAPDANSNGWTTASAVDLGLYHIFTITPAAGGTSWNGLTLDVANFDAEAIENGPT